MIHEVSKNYLSLEKAEQIITQKQKLRLSKEATAAIQKCRDYLDTKMQDDNNVFYGINTGFGSLCNVKVEGEQLTDLQHNLVKSHACGMGQEVPQEIVKIMLFLKIQSLSYGHSGVSVEVVNRLIDFYNHDALPVIYQQGSLGASGDLAPLAHLALCLINEGEMYFQGKKVPSSEVHDQLGWKALALQSKEGLALLNGTQFSLAYLVYAAWNGQRLSKIADLVSTLSLEGFDGRISPFDERVHKNRPHDGQVKTAARIRALLDGSQIIQQEKTDVQDPYAFRCVPQVHGASKDTLTHVCKVAEVELNSVTDNPNIFPDSDAIISGGNFHAQPLALASDFLSIALAELGSVSERRTYQLIGGKRNLPPFLTDGAGLHSGFMICQYTAASIVSQNKQLCTPASVDSIVSCNGQEDHVSMAANAGTKCYQVVQNLESLLGIELMLGARALDYRRPKTSSSWIEKLYTDFRKEISTLGEDRIMYKDQQQCVEFLKKMDIDSYLPM